MNCRLQDVVGDDRGDDQHQHQPPEIAPQESPEEGEDEGDEHPHATEQSSGAQQEDRLIEPSDSVRDCPCPQRMIETKKLRPHRIARVYRRKRLLMSGQNSSKRFPASRPTNPLAQRSIVWRAVVALGGSHAFSTTLFTTLPAYRPHAGAR